MDLLPTGKTVHRYKPYYDHHCPSCGEEYENRSHILRCRHETRTPWQNKLLTKVRKEWEEKETSQVLLAVIVDGLEAWFNDTAFPEARHPPGVQELIKDQNEIGWEQLFYGRFSTKWKEYQKAELKRQRQEQKEHNCGSPWIRTVIEIIWEAVRDEWKLRNDVRHGKDDEEKALKQMEQAERQIKHWYEKKKWMETEVQRLVFKDSVHEELKNLKDTQSRQQWLAQWGPLFEASLIRARKKDKNVDMETEDDTRD
jgi:hypothetical protein